MDPAAESHHPHARAWPSSPPVQPVTTREQRQQYARAIWRPTRRASRARRMAVGLGCLSVGLGMVQLLAPQPAARAIGVPDQPWLTRAMGLRELACGIGILASERPAAWLAVRAAGDALDLALLARAARRPDPAHSRGLGLRLALASAAVASAAVLDVRAALLQQEVQSAEAPQRIEHSITVNRPPAEVYRFWRDFANFPRFMRHIESVRALSPRRSHWVARGPLGKVVEWDAEITVDQPDRLLAWRSVDDAELANFGTVRFLPVNEGQGTVLHVELYYAPVLPRPLMWLARLFGRSAADEVGSDLLRLKQLLETGSLPAA